MITILDQAIGLLSNQTNKKMVRHLNSNLEAFDITLEQWIVILTLSDQDRISQKQLAEKVDKDQPTLARILDILERKGLAERQPSKEDRRAFLVHITERGREIKEKIAPFLEGIFVKMLSGISEEKINIFREVLMKINTNITKQIEEEK